MQEESIRSDKMAVEETNHTNTSHPEPGISNSAVSLRGLIIDVSIVCQQWIHCRVDISGSMKRHKFHWFRLSELRGTIVDVSGW